MSNRKLIAERKQKAKRIFAVVLMIIFLSIPVAVLAAGYYEIWYDSKPLNNEEEYYISYCDIATDNVQLYEGDRVYVL